MSRAKYINTADAFGVVEGLKANATSEQKAIADYILRKMGTLKTVDPTDADVGRPPVCKTKTATSHVMYANGRSEWKEDTYTAWLCPVCDWFVGSHRVTRGGEKKKPCNFCTRCGQRIDWAGVDLGEEYDSPSPLQADVVQGG